MQALLGTPFKRQVHQTKQFGSAADWWLVADVVGGPHDPQHGAGEPRSLPPTRRPSPAGPWQLRIKLDGPKASATLVGAPNMPLRRASVLSPEPTPAWQAILCTCRQCQKLPRGGSRCCSNCTTWTSSNDCTLSISSQAPPAPPCWHRAPDCSPSCPLLALACRGSGRAGRRSCHAGCHTLQQGSVSGEGPMEAGGD